MNVFHGARVSDIARTAKLLKGALAKTSGAVEPSKPQPPLIGVGYSMGAIILANYVARSGSDCSLDAAVSVSGGLDMREQFHFHRSMRLWQPMLAQDLRQTVMRGTRQKYETRLTEEHFLDLVRSVHITVSHVLMHQ
jgi:predicted alpha/beta-fold hydrolase